MHDDDNNNNNNNNSLILSFQVHSKDKEKKSF